MTQTPRDPQIPAAPRQKGPKPVASPQRQAREAEALRDNLRRRKAQQRAADETPGRSADGDDRSSG